MAARTTTSTTAARVTSLSSVAARTTTTSSAAAAASTSSASSARSSSSASAASSSVTSSSSARASSSAAASSSSSAAVSTATINSSSIQAFISQSATGGSSSGNGTGLKPSTIGAIVGGIVGGLILLVAAFKLWRRRRRWMGSGDRTPPPPPQPMQYRGGMHSRVPSEMKRASSYNALAMPGLSHQSSMGVLSSTPGSPYAGPMYAPDTPATAFDQDPERLYLESPELPAPQPVYRSPLNDHAEGAAFAPALLPAGADEDAYNTSPPSTSSSPAPVDFPSGSPSGAGIAPSIRTTSNSAESSLEQRALASRSASNSSTTSSPPLLPDGTRRPSRSRSTQQLQRMSQHQRNLTISTAGWAPSSAGFSPSHRSASRYSMSGLPRDVSVRDLSGTPHNGRPIALTMPTPLSQSTSQEGYLRPASTLSMYGAPAGYGGGVNEFGAYGSVVGSAAASSVGSMSGRDRRHEGGTFGSRPPSALGPAA